MLFSVAQRTAGAGAWEQGYSTSKSPVWVMRHFEEANGCNRHPACMGVSITETPYPR